jgi:hypothetical protein
MNRGKENVINDASNSTFNKSNIQQGRNQGILNNNSPEQKKDSEKEEICKLSESEILLVAEKTMADFNTANDDLEISKYRFLYCVLVVSSAVFAILISLSNPMSGYNPRSLVFFLISILSLSVCILSTIISLYGKIDFDKRILSKRNEQIKKPGLGLERAQKKDGEALLFESNPVKKRKIFLICVDISLISFSISIISLTIYMFFK